LNELDKEEMPPSMIAALDALRSAGSEAQVETCDICGLIMPASLAKPFTGKACPKCIEGAHVRKYRKLMARPEDDPDPGECEPPEAPPDNENEAPF
jgi:recombinational DNA repair protein (RecF pathway)